MALLPKEHGAFGQMAFPLLTALIVSGISAAALSWMVAVIAGFMAHEPLLVVLGRRGKRVRREQWRPAGWSLLGTGLLTGAAFVLAIAWAVPEFRWSLAVPLVPASLVAAAIAAGREKSWQGEIAVATTFSMAAVPASLLSGAAATTAFAIAFAFWVIFVAATLAVRTIILRVRAGGSPRAVRASRFAVLAFTAAALGGVFTAALRGMLPWTLLASIALPLFLASSLAAYPPAPVRLRMVGWSLVAATTVAAAVLVFGLRTA